LGNPKSNKLLSSLFDFENILLKKHIKNAIIALLYPLLFYAFIEILKIRIRFIFE